MSVPKERVDHDGKGHGDILSEVTRLLTFDIPARFVGEVEE